MKKIVLALLGAFSLLFVSCETTKLYNLNSFPVIDAGDAPRYVVLGEINASSCLSMTNDEFSKLVRNELSYEPQTIQAKFLNDTGDYGFIGKPVNIKMNVFERSAALAEYKLIEIAKLNEADAILCFKSETKVEPGFKNTMVTTNVSGYAVRVKPDSGYTIKLPEPEEPKAPEVSEEEAEVSDVSEE